MSYSASFRRADHAAAGSRLATRRLLLLVAVAVVVFGCSPGEQVSPAHTTAPGNTLAILIESNRPAVLQAIEDEHGVIVLEVEQTGTLRVEFEVDGSEALLEIQQRLRRRGITAVVPAPGVPLLAS